MWGGSWTIAAPCPLQGRYKPKLTEADRRRAAPVSPRQAGPRLVALEAVPSLAAVVCFPADAQRGGDHHQARAALALRCWVWARDFCRQHVG